jgi:hypothetical protein
MAKPKAGTLQQKLGFRDADLTTPKHDEMMLWLHENMVTFLVDHGLWTPQRATQKSFERQKRRGMENWREEPAWDSVSFLDMPPAPSPKEQIKILWEYPITSGRNKYMIGFIDMLVSAWGDYSYLYNEYEKTWSIHGKSTKHFFIEIKTKIPSLGELVRQIRTYQTHVNGSHNWIVVCPDDRFREPLASQGITLVKYTGETP